MSVFDNKNTSLSVVNVLLSCEIWSVNMSVLNKKNKNNSLSVVNMLLSCEIWRAQMSILNNNNQNNSLSVVNMLLSYEIWSANMSVLTKKNNSLWVVKMLLSYGMWHLWTYDSNFWHLHQTTFDMGRHWLMVAHEFSMSCLVSLIIVDIRKEVNTYRQNTDYCICRTNLHEWCICGCSQGQICGHLLVSPTESEWCHQPVQHLCQRQLEIQCRLIVQSCNRHGFMLPQAKWTQISYHLLLKHYCDGTVVIVF